MIRSLSIKNYALIQELEMQPSDHLNIITGETGAGKSIMLGALGLLLGHRADVKSLFSDQEKCTIEAIFDLKRHDLKALFEEQELDYDDECIIRREISPTGKSRGFINDTPVTLNVMKAIGRQLMDIHSQHESLELGNNTYQQQTLDLFAKNGSILKEYKKTYQLFRKAEKLYDELTTKAQKQASETDYQQFLFNELESAQLKAGELEELEAELEKLEHAEEIKSNLTQINQLLDEAEYAVLQQIKECSSLLGTIKNFGKSYNEHFERLESVSIELKDLAGEIAKEEENVELDPERLHMVKERVDLLFRLQQKHNTQSIGDLIQLRDQLAEELEQFSNMDEAIAKAKKALDSAEKDLLAIGDQLSQVRNKKAPELTKAIENIIHKLGIENGQLTFQITRTAPQPSGLDQIELLFSANKGIAPQELRKVASGGEFSRLIFAIKFLLADKTALPTIIFDEIDTGVSGEVALQMINMMKTMSERHQIIAISHLPQFAAGGDAHYFVYKDHSAEKSVSKIRTLEEEERVLEIAKMIGGKEPGAHALESARQLLSTAG